MSGRTNADIIADLRAVIFETPLDNTRQAALHAAADRLADLDALWQAVWTDPMGIQPEGHMKCEPCALCVLEHLRGVKP